MSLNFVELEKKYKSDAAFNKMVNLFSQLIEEYQFQPSELREGVFYAQWVFESNRAKEIIRTQEEWQKINDLHTLLREKFVSGDKNEKSE